MLKLQTYREKCQYYLIFHDKIEIVYPLIDDGHSIIVIEHNMEVIKCADWIIDFGPEAGLKGGEIVFTGTPEDLVKCEGSYTGKYLRL